MPGPYGITANGFTKPTLAEIVTDIGTTYLQKYGSSCNLLAPSLMATQIGIQADREADIWDVAEECWNARARSTSQGVSLDNAGELTNEERLGPLPSQTFLQYFWGTIGTLIDTTFLASVVGNPTAQFAPLAAAILVAGVDEVQAIGFSATADAGTWTFTLPDGQELTGLAFGILAATLQADIQALTGWATVTVTGSMAAGFVVTYTGGVVGKRPWSLASATSALTASSVPVTINITQTTLGVAQGVATMACQTYGPIVAPAGTLSVIVTPVSGLAATGNGDDATVGRLVETDANYRIRAQTDIQSTSKTTVEGIRANLLANVPNILDVIVYQNTTLITDGNSVPGKAIHVYADGGTDQDVGNALWTAVGGGIETYGMVSVNVVDSQGFTQVVNFDRPTTEPVYVIVTITPNAAYPANGDALVLDAILTYGATLQTGDDVLLRPKLLPAIVDNVPGIEDIVITIGFAPSPSGTSNLSVDASERATFLSGNITVNS